MQHTPDHPTPAEMTSGQIAKRSGVAISTLHFYERQGLIASRRTAGNQRRYRRDTLRRSGVHTTVLERSPPHRGVS